MPLFLTIMEGDRPSEAKPLVATGDENLIGLVVDELCRRLSEQRVSGPKDTLKLFPLSGKGAGGLYPQNPMKAPGEDDAD